jgi:hypothetical protein
MLLHVYMLTGPLVIGAFLKHPGFGTFLSTASVLGFFALNKTAEELEGARPYPDTHCIYSDLVGEGLLQD